MARATKIAVWSVLGVVGGAAVGLAVLVATFDGEHLKGIVAERVGSATGRDLAIDGAIGIDWGWVPRVTLHRVTLSNAAWSRDETMAEIERLSFRIELAELLRGRIVLPEVTFDRPRLVLERNADGAANWTFEPTGAVEAAAPDERSEVPIVERLTIDDGDLVYRDPNRDIAVRSRVSTVIGEGGEGRERVTVVGTGTVAGEPFELELAAGPLVDLRDPDEPYPLEATARVGDTAARLDGTLLQPTRFAGLDVALAIRGDDVGDLFPIIGLPAPTTPPYEAAGRLIRDGDVWRFEGFDGRVGDSDLAGTLAFHTGGERLRITGDLRSDRLDFDDLAGLVGAPPRTAAGETASAEQRRLAEIYARSAKVLPTAPADFAKFRTVDAAVRFAGATVIAPGLPLEEVAVDVRLDRGVLRLDPLEVGVAGGHVAAAIVIDARRDTVVADLDLRLDGFRLERVLEGVGGAGEIFGRARLRTVGNSVSAAFGRSDGNVALMMNDGTFSNLTMELLGLDAAEALGFVLGEDRAVPIRCAVVDLAVADGVMRSRAFVLDTTDTKLLGEGAVDLGAEAFRIELLAHPKDPSLFSARAPVTITGSFRDAGVTVDAAAVGIRAGIAVALGALLTPLAGALAFIEPGLGDDSPCRALMRDARQNADAPPDR